MEIPLKLSDLNPNEIVTVSQPKLSLSSINPDDIEHVGVSNQDVPPPSGGEAFARGLSQGATFGFGDELGGGLYAIKDAATKMSLSDLVKDYIKNRNEIRANDEKAQKAHPWLYGGGEVTGGVGTLLVPGMGAANTLKGATGLGALYGFGKSNAELSDPLNVAIDTAKGAGFGAAGYGAGKLVSNLLPTSKNLGEFAEREAAKHLRPTPTMARDLGPEGLRAVGREALDSGAIEFGAKAENTAANLADLLQEVGQVKGDIVAAAKGGMHPQEIANRVQNEVIAPLGQTAEGQTLAAKIQDKLDKFLSHYGENISPQQLEAEKMAVQNNINWSGDPKASTEALMGYAKTLRKGAEELIPDEAFKAAKQTYGNLLDAKTMADRTAGLTDGGNGLIGHMYDLTAGHVALDAATHGNPIGLPIAAARGLTKGRVHSALAVGADKASKFLAENPNINTAIESAGNMVRGSSPVATREFQNFNPSRAASLPNEEHKDIANRPQAKLDSNELIQKLSNAPNSNKYIQAIQQAASRGPEALSSTHFILLQTEPEYQRATQGEY
jgi:hypothetical protein